MTLCLLLCLLLLSIVIAFNLMSSTIEPFAGNFANYCLTERPRVGGVHSIYSWWNGPLYQMADQIASGNYSKDSAPGSPAPNGLPSEEIGTPVDDLHCDNEFYHDPNTYCLKHPNKIVCSNSWVRTSA